MHDRREFDCFWTESLLEQIAVVIRVEENVSMATNFGNLLRYSDLMALVNRVPMAFGIDRLVLWLADTKYWPTPWAEFLPSFHS